MNETVLLGEIMNYDSNIPFTLVHYFRKHFMTWGLRPTTLPYLNLCTDTLGVY